MIKSFHQNGQRLLLVLVRRILFMMIQLCSCKNLFRWEWSVIVGYMSNSLMGI